MLSTALLACLAAGCSSTVVTPASIAAADVPEDVRVAERAKWTSAVEIANEFLASPYRRTLPAGRYELAETGMSYVSERGTWPIEVRCSTWGDNVVAFGYRAQEREYGFVVGKRPPNRDRSVDNSMFVDGDGLAHDAESIAALILHETTHVVVREGTVGFWNGVAYYLEAIFLLRSASHSAERYPHGTNEEFGFFRIDRDSDDAEPDTWLHFLDDHIAKGGGKNCRHGPLPPEVRAPSRARS